MKLYLVPVLFFILLSCSAKEKVPKDVIPIAKVPAVLWDVMQADALVKIRSADTSFKRFDSSIQLYGQVLQLHHITPDEFKKSIKFYQSRPDLLQIIFDSLQRRADTPVPDSIKTQ